jgi:hypothetical protein
MKYPQQSTCKRCQREMTEVATILPMGGSPGLVAFLCARCGKSKSILVQPELQIRGKQLDRPGGYAAESWYQLARAV